MEREAKLIANNPHVRVNLQTQWDGHHHIGIEIIAKAPSQKARGRTQLAQIADILKAAGIPHIHIGPEELDGSKVPVIQRVANIRNPKRWGVIVIHSRSAPGNKPLTAQQELDIRRLYQGLRSSGARETKIRNR